MRLVLLLTGALCISVAAAAASGSIEDVHSIVIFMQENRAFDHYFGTLDGVSSYAAASERNARLISTAGARLQRPCGATPQRRIPAF
jgi:phospholipase C